MNSTTAKTVVNQAHHSQGTGEVIKSAYFSLQLSASSSIDKQHWSSWPPCLMVYTAFQLSLTLSPKGQKSFSVLNVPRYGFNFTNDKILFQRSWMNEWRKVWKKQRPNTSKHIIYISIEHLNIYNTLQVAEQNGAKSSTSGKSTCLFTFRRLKPALKRTKNYF